MTPNHNWITEPGLFSRWLEVQLGLPPWLIFAVVFPIVTLLLLFLLREMGLAALFLLEGPRKHRTLWRRISFHSTTLLAILAVGAVWRIRVDWVAESLGPTLGTGLNEYLTGFIYALLATLILGLLLYVMQRILGLALSKLRDWAETARGLRFQKTVFLKPRRIRQWAELCLRVLRMAFLFAAVYIYIPLLLSFFPLTAPFADVIMPYVTGPVLQIGSAIIGYIPKLLTLILIILVIRYFLKFARFTMSALSNEEIQLPGFDPDWGDPTYRLIRGVIILMGVMISYPYLPGSGSEIFKGFSIFVGALVTLGSSAAINNIISGVVLTYTRAFRVGDRVRIGNTLGDIVEKKLFVTRVRTLDNDEVTLPNGMVLGGSISNLSAATGTDGLALRVSAGIGYDVDWRKVHELLKKAALQTPHILSDPEPSVVETELGDFAVSYMLIAHTDEPKRARLTTAELRRSALDLFNAEGIEIMTPSVSALRDGNQPAIPKDFTPKPFRLPGFEVFLRQQEEEQS